MYDPDTQDQDFSAELRTLKAHYIGFMRTSTWNLPREIFDWASGQHQEYFGAPLSRGCSKCHPEQVHSLLIKTGIGTH